MLRIEKRGNCRKNQGLAARDLSRKRDAVPVRKVNSCERASAPARARESASGGARNRIVLMPFKLIELENEPM